MALRTYTEDELREIALAQIRANIDGADTAPYGDYDMWARVLAAIAAGSQSHASALGRQHFPATCDEAELAAHGEARGLGYLAPTKARGYAAIAGAAGDVLPAGSYLGAGKYVTLSDVTCGAGSFTPVTVAKGSGRERLIVSSTTGITEGTLLSIGTAFSVVKAIPAPGIIDLWIPLDLVSFVGDLISGIAGALVPIEAVSAGVRAGFNYPGETLPVDAPPLGTSIDPVAIMVDTDYGADAETPPSYRQRIVDFDAGRAASTNVERIRSFARAFPDARIFEAFVYPNLGYPGHTYVVAYGPPAGRELSLLNTDALETFLLSAVGSEVDITVEPISYDGTPADIDLTSLAGTGFEPDWGTSTTNAFTIGAGSSPSRVELTTSPIGIIPVGGRVLVPIVLGAVYRTEQRQVRAVDATGVDLETDLSADPTTGGTVTSGSPAAQAMIDGVFKMFDALGPGTYVASATKDRVRWPNPSTTGGAVVSETSVLFAAAVPGLVSVAFTSGSFAMRTPAALQTIRLGILTLRHTYP